MEPFTIRPLAAEDEMAWGKLRHALWPAEEEEALRGEMGAILSRADAPVWLAYDVTGAAIGLIEIEIRDEAPGSDGQPVPYIEGWYVVPEWRGRGVGGALVRAAEEWALALGHTRMASDTTPEYPLSPEAHAALGYRTVQVTYHFIKQLRATG